MKGSNIKNIIGSMLVLGGIIYLGVYLFGEEEVVLQNGGKSIFEPVPLGEGQTVEQASLFEKKYSHGILGFSFNYPKDFSISSFGNYFDSAGETILLQKESGKEGLQILITPFDEDTQLTIARIKKDIPSLQISNPEEKTIGGDNGVKIVTFSSDNNLTTGSSLEGWFVHRGNLYQISAQAGSKELFEKIISTWKLEE